MVNGTADRERPTASGWSYSLLDSPSTEISLQFSESDNGLPQPVHVTVKRIVRERGHWPTAEIVIKVEPPRRVKGVDDRKVYRGRLSLLSTSGKRDCVRACKDAYPPLTAQWAEIVEAFTDEALSKMAERVKPVMIGNGKVNIERPKYQVEPLLQHHQPNLLWGNSDIGKSWLAVWICAVVENGLEVCGLRGDTGHCLYVDYETTEDAMRERVVAVRAGLNGQLPDTWDLRYQAATGSLTDWIDDLARYVSKEQIDLVVIDSLGLALGGVVNESENVVKLYEAVRELDATTLLIDHQGKGDDANQRGAIGSSYKRHYARSEWEMRREDGDGFTIGLYHRKANNARKVSGGIGLSVDIESDDDGRAQTATFTRTDVHDSPDLAKGLSIPRRIKVLLRDGSKSLDYIRESIPDENNSSIVSALSWMVKKGQLKRHDRGLYGLLSDAN